ncbi:hypothetical protein CsatB_030633 [Cannabis sativa]
MGSDSICLILILGAGPIVIGPICEFDYSGTQACKALKEEGYEVILIHSNPDLADRTYITPMTPELVEQVLEKYWVELIGAKLEAVKKAEDRELFKEAMKNIGHKDSKNSTFRIGTTLDDCIEIAYGIGEFPLIIRHAFTWGGSCGGIAYNREKFETICKAGLNASLTTQVLVEKSLLGWKEHELEVMKALDDNVVIICSNGSSYWGVYDCCSSSNFD